MNDHSLNRSHDRLVRLSMMALMAAMAYLCMVLFRVPVVLFLQYEPKDVILALTALWLGPLEGLAVSVVVAAVEMVTVSNTGWWGFMMNVLASAAFILPAGILYRVRRTRPAALLGLLLGILVSTATMLLWNYWIVPLYTPTITREAIVPLLWSAFLPFNLFKDGLNAAVTGLLLFPLFSALSRARLLPPGKEAPSEHSARRLIVWTAGLLLFAAAMCAALLWLSGTFG